MIPAGGVEHRTFEIPQPGNVRVARVMQQAAAGDDEVDDCDLAIAVVNSPALAVVVGAGDVLVEDDAAAQVVLLDDAQQVLLDFRALRQPRAPVRVRHALIGVVVRGDIAADAGVGVFTPGSADLAGLVDNLEVVDAGFDQLHRHQHAGHAGTDDQHPRLARHRHSTSKTS